jgi:phosphohistidine phosphatase
MAASGAEVQQIRHSGLLRARQTAEIFGQHLKPAGGVIAVEGLTYEDPVEPVAESLVLEPESLMLVGHNPFMEQLTGLLLTGNASRTPVSFGTSSTVCLERIEGVWVLKWALHRELIPGGEKE